MIFFFIIYNINFIALYLMFSLTLWSIFIIIILMSFSANSIFSVISMSVSIYFFFPGYGSHFSLLCMSSNCLMIVYVECWILHCF